LLREKGVTEVGGPLDVFGELLDDVRQAASEGMLGSQSCFWTASANCFSFRPFFGPATVGAG
jgi:hypothetical protein